MVFNLSTHRILGAEIRTAWRSASTPRTSDAASIPHPTLSKSIGMTAEAFDGTLTDLYVPKNRK